MQIKLTPKGTERLKVFGAVCHCSLTILWRVTSNRTLTKINELYINHIKT